MYIYINIRAKPGGGGAGEAGGDATGAVPQRDFRDAPHQRGMSLTELSDTKVYEPYLRARLGTAAQFCEEVVLKSKKLFSIL